MIHQHFQTLHSSISDCWLVRVSLVIEMGAKLFWKRVEGNLRQLYDNKTYFTVTDLRKGAGQNCGVKLWNKSVVQSWSWGKNCEAKL